MVDVLNAGRTVAHDLVCDVRPNRTRVFRYVNCLWIRNMHRLTPRQQVLGVDRAHIRKDARKTQYNLFGMCPYILADHFHDSACPIQSSLRREPRAP